MFIKKQLVYYTFYHSDKLPRSHETLGGYYYAVNLIQANKSTNEHGLNSTTRIVKAGFLLCKVQQMHMHTRTH